METPVPKRVMDYMDHVKNIKKEDVTEADILKHLEMGTESIQTFCYMIDYMDRWERQSHEFKTVTALHLAVVEMSKRGDESAKEYMKFYWRSTDPEDEAGKIIAGLVETADERYATAN